ncbi:MAG TPA: uroporphyrinogen decarboxylase family protein [Treponemataceae bacterium]|jgi:uroporphyrinogen-III decarboxylase|nr:uroporphyrinogen decarboxylase family protein [Treponemataceae bacterium]
MSKQLISYIAPSAPATRRTASGNEPFLRLEIGFTPNWYHEAIGIDFGYTWHWDVAYRRKSILAMRRELQKRFPGTAIGQINEPDHPLDLLTGLFGTCTVAALFDTPIIYSSDNWPNCEQRYLTNRQIDALTTPDLNSNDFYQRLLCQVQEIAKIEGVAKGFINWQGVLNNALRLRGENLFLDMVDDPERAHHLFEVICETMIGAIRQLHLKQAQFGFLPGFVTVSNCSVNMISPQQYRNFILPKDKQIAQFFGSIGIHNCAWTADPYMIDYSTVPNLGYIDMGLESDLVKAKTLFPNARRALMYTPMDLVNKDRQIIKEDIRRIAKEYAPCDIVAADIESETPDEAILDFIRMCQEVSADYV